MLTHHIHTKIVGFRVSGPRDGCLLEKRWILGGVYQDDRLLNVPWDIEMMVEESLSDDEEGDPTVSPTPSPSLNPKKTLTKFDKIVA